MVASLATIVTLLLFYVNVTPNVYAADELTADFTADQSSVDIPLTVHFTFTQTLGGIFECKWDFGDGNFGNGYTINHTYGSPGQYLVTLTIKNGSGSQGHATRHITVYPGGSVSPTVEPSVTPSGSASIIPGIIETPRPPTATPVPATATPQPTEKASGMLDLGGGIKVSQDAMQLIIAGVVAAIIAAIIVIAFTIMGKRQGDKKDEKPTIKPPAPPVKPKVKDKTPKPVKKSEENTPDFSQDYIYGLVTGKAEGDAEQPPARKQNDQNKK